MSGVDGALARLILVNVMWSEWVPERDQHKYENIVNKFLPVCMPRSGGSDYAYLHECHAMGDARDTTWTDQVAAYELPPKDHCKWPERWLGGNDWQNGGQSFSGLAAQESGGAPIHRVSEWGDMFRTRIFMGADCYRTALGYKGKATYWILIDMRFQELPLGSVLWHTSLSVWSHHPRSWHHCPRQVRRSPSRSLSLTEMQDLIRDWERTRSTFQRLISSPDDQPLRVFGRSYLPPSFLVAVPDPSGTAASGDVAETANQLTALRQMSNEIVWTQNYESLPHALVKGGIHTFRRFLPAGDIDVPRYLMIPDTQTRIRDPKQVDAWRAIQEEAAAVGTRILTDLEAYAANELDGIDSRMRIRESHLKIYKGVADQAGTLWDALARLLPDARGRRLEMLHRSIELIHQTLLQGVADLDQLVRNIDDALSHIESTADEVADRFSRQLDHPPSGREGQVLSDSLRGGYFDQLRRHVGEASATAARVTESYRTLLETIGMAFDERRVREGDRLQRPTVAIALAFGILGLSGVAQATLPIQVVSGPIVLIMRVFLWVLTFGAIIGISYQVWKLRSLGRVARPKFERRYEKVRNFLAEVSTDHLENLTVSAPLDQTENAAWWSKIDQKLCGEFVTAWTAAWRTVDSGRVSDLGSYDVKPLRSRAETWTLQALMLTERPRDFSRYPLPRLTCLYRICTAKALKQWRTADEMPNADSAVGEAELEEALPDRKYGLVFKNLLANEQCLMGKETGQLAEELLNGELWCRLRLEQDLSLGR